MAPLTLPESPSTTFQQRSFERIYDGVFVRVADPWFGPLIRRVDQLLTRSQLSRCEYEEERNPFGCSEQGTITDLDSRRPLCAGHFREVNR